MRVELGVEDVVKDRSMKVSYDTLMVDKIMISCLPLLLGV